MVEKLVLNGSTIAPKINNLKIRTYVKENCLNELLKNILEIEEKNSFPPTNQKKTIFKRFHNFIVFRCEFVFIIFPKRGAVNITGIKKIQFIKTAIQVFSNIFKISQENLGPIIIDNVTASGSFNTTINLQLLKKIVNEKLISNSILASASFNSSHFPGCFCRSHSVGTVAIFASGKFNIIGSKCLKHVSLLFSAMAAYINQL